MISKHGREFASMAELRRYERNKGEYMESKGKWTPGPWKVYHEGGSMGSGGHWGVEMKSSEPCFPSITVAIMSQRENARMNATLIAAAPEMAEALQEIAERADSMAQEADENSEAHAAFIRIRDDAMSALRKARGEER